MITFFRIGLVSILLLSTSVFADCHSFIINVSTKDWVFDFKPDDAGSANATNCHPCTVRANTPFQLEYPLGYVAKSGTVDISDANGVTKSYTYNLSPKGECPYIWHDNEPHTGNVLLNEPENGSFIIEHDTW